MSSLPTERPAHPDVTDHLVLNADSPRINATGDDLVAKYGRDPVASLSLPGLSDNRVVIDLDSEILLQSALADIDLLEQNMLNVASGACTIWIERGPLDEPLPLLLTAKIGSSCIHVPINVRVRVTVSGNKPDMKGSIGLADRRRFLRRIVCKFVPKIKSLIKKVVNSRFFVDARANNDRIVRQALLIHPIAIFPAQTRPSLFRVFSLEGAFYGRPFDLEKGCCHTFSITVDMENHTIWAAMPTGLVPFATPPLIFPRPVQIEALLGNSVKPITTRKYFVSFFYDPDQSPTVTTADFVLDTLGASHTPKDRVSYLRVFRPLLLTIPVSIWQQRGLIHVLLKCLCEHPVSNAVVDCISSIFTGMANNREFVDFLVNSLLVAIEKATHCIPLLFTLLTLVSNSALVCLSAVDQHAIQRLFNRLKYLNWESCGNFNDEATHEVKKPATLIAPLKSILMDANLFENQIGYRYGQDAILAELSPLLHHIRDVRMTSLSGSFAVPISSTASPLEVWSRNNTSHQSGPVIAMRILIHLISGLPESYPVPINIGALLNVAELLLPTAIPSAKAVLVQLVSACESRSTKSLSFIDVIVRRLIPLSAQTSRATVAVLRLASSLLEADSSCCTKSELLLLVTAELFKHVSQLAAIELILSQETISTLTALIRTLAIICKINDSPSINNLIYVSLVRDINAFDRIANLLNRVIQPDISDLIMVFLNACLTLFRHVPKLAQRLKATPKRVHKLYTNSRVIYGFPSGVLYKWMHVLSEDNGPMACAPYRMYFLEKISIVLTRATMWMELLTSQYADLHQDRICWHYKRFLRIYCKAELSHMDIFLCRLHVQLLLSLAETRTKQALSQFDELRVALFLTAEMSLEYESRLPHKFILRHVHRRRSIMGPEIDVTLQGANDIDENSRDDSSDSAEFSAKAPSIFKIGVPLNQPNSNSPDNFRGPSSPNDYDAADIPGVVDSSGQSASSLRPVTIVPRLHLKRNSIQTSKSSNTEYIEQRILRAADENRKMRHYSSHSSIRGLRDSKIRESAKNSKQSSFDSQAQSDEDDLTDSMQDDNADILSSSLNDDDESEENVLAKAMKKISGPIATLRRASIETSQSAFQLLGRHFSMDSAMRSSLAYSAPKSKTTSGKSMNSLKSGQSVKSGGSMKSGGGNSAGTLKSRTSSARVRVGSVASSIWPTQIQHRYFEKRQQRPMYRDRHLHIAMIRLLLRLMIDRNQMTLNNSLCHRMPITNLPHQLNIPFILHQHINYPANSRVFEKLEALEIQAGQAPYRLLRLLSIRSFHSTGIVHNHRKAKGRFGAIFESHYPNHREPVAVKVVDVPFAYHDYCVVHDLFAEIAVMERFRNCSHICHLYDYGVNENGYQLVMSLFPMSLKQWRLSCTNAQSTSAVGSVPDTKSSEHQRKANLVMLETCLNIYNDLIYAVSDLHANNCIHFDVKCDNVLIRPVHLPSSRIMHPDKSQSIQVALTDFGESLMWNPSLGEEGNSLIGRGTENIQSPEILSLTSPDNESKRRSISAGSKSRDNQLVSTGADVWAIGCLFYELLTGEFLFEEKHGMPIFFQVDKVISKSQPVVAHKQKSTLSSLFGEAISDAITGFLSAVLIRNVKGRPDIQGTLNMFHQLRSVIHQIRINHQKTQKSSPIFQRITAARMFIQRSLQKLKMTRTKYQVEGSPSIHVLAQGRDMSWGRAASVELESPPTPLKTTICGMERMIVYECLRDGFPKFTRMPSQMINLIRRVTTMCWVAACADLPAKALSRIYRAGFNQVVHCGVQGFQHEANISNRKILVLGGKYAGACHSLPLTGRVREQRCIVNDLADWIGALVDPCARLMIQSVLKGNAVMVCGHDPMTPFVVVLVYLIRAYHVSLLEAFLVLRQNQTILAIDPKILSAIQLWIDKDSPRLPAVKTSQNQFGCFCAQLVIKLTVAGISDQIRPCACEIHEDVDCASSSCWYAMKRYRNLYGRDFSRLHWRRSTIGDLILTRCRLSQLVVYETSKAMTARREWTSFACRQCHYILVAVPGAWKVTDLSTMNPDLELAIVTNLSQMADNRPNGFHVVSEFHTTTSEADDRKLIDPDCYNPPCW